MKHIIDISAVFFRYYFAPGPVVINDEGYDVSALLSSLRWLLKPEFLPAESTICCFDESLGTGFRHELDPEYKANRPLPTEDIIYQLSALKLVCETLGFAVLASDELEADDLIATAIQCYSVDPCVIHSRDKDLRQLLIEGRVTMQDVATNQIWTQKRLEEEVGLAPQQIPLYLAMVGDVSDNIPGVPGIGDKTALRLLQAYEDWPQIMDAVHSDDILPVRGSARIKQNILEYQDRIVLNLKLTQLKVLKDQTLRFKVRTSDQIDELMAQCEVLGIAHRLKKPLQRLTS